MKSIIGDNDHQQGNMARVGTPRHFLHILFTDSHGFKRLMDSELETIFNPFLFTIGGSILHGGLHTFVIKCTLTIINLVIRKNWREH